MLPLRSSFASMTARASMRAIPRSLAPYSTLGKKAADDVSSKWQGTTANGGKTKNYIGGKFVDSSAGKWLDVYDPVRSHTGAHLFVLASRADFSPHRR